MWTHPPLTQLKIITTTTSHLWQSHVTLDLCDLNPRGDLEDPGSFRQKVKYTYEWLNRKYLEYGNSPTTKYFPVLLRERILKVKPTLLKCISKVNRIVSQTYLQVPLFFHSVRRVHPLTNFNYFFPENLFHSELSSTVWLHPTFLPMPTFFIDNLSLSYVSTLRSR